ncbi:MAG: hypothetical protein R2705_22465 [Ilumatobacteraceae bacterium]
MALMESSDAEHRYSVAWLDLLASGRHLGRSILSQGDHAPLGAVPPAKRSSALGFRPHTFATVPPIVPRAGVLNGWTIAAFNEVWYRKAPKLRTGQLQSLTSFFHPLDGVTHWNRLYGARGFIQYQFVVPFGQEPTLQRIVERCSQVRAASFVTVLKRFGAANPSPLSFPTPGWTLTIDLATTQPGLAALTQELDAWVLEAGGRHYLAKDAVTSPEVIRAGYPRLDDWRAIRDKADPTHRWQSDQARRLGLV